MQVDAPAPITAVLPQHASDRISTLERNFADLQKQMQEHGQTITAQRAATDMTNTKINQLSETVATQGQAIATAATRLEGMAGLQTGIEAIMKKLGVQKPETEAEGAPAQKTPRTGEDPTR